MRAAPAAVAAVAVAAVVGSCRWELPSAEDPEPCMGSECVCVRPFARCGGACVDPRRDRTHCGGCGRVCEAGQDCFDARCVCPPDRATCDGDCVDLRFDVRHCGRCGGPCRAGSACCAGRCVDPTTDRSHCGACGVVCAVGVPCVQGHCSRLLTGFGGPSGFGEGTMAPADDGSSPAVDLRAAFPRGLAIGGASYASLYVNVNGNVTFRAVHAGYTPTALPSLTQPMIAPWWADVDTRGAAPSPGANRVWWHVRAGQFVATWFNVGYYSTHTDRLDSFQLVLRDRPELAAGDFDGEFRYERCEWTTGDASGGLRGLGGTPALAGADGGNMRDAFELPGSRTMAILMLCGSSNAGLDGVWRFRFRGGRPTVD